MKEKQLRIFEFNGDKEIKEEYDKMFRFLPDDLEKEAAKEGLVHASKILQQDYDVVILDEINYVMSKGLVDVNKVIDIIKQRNPKTEVVLTGRNPPKEIIDMADYVSEVKMIKHPYQKNILARAGIDF